MIITEVPELSYVRWNAIYSSADRLLYIPTPKVACTSVKWWFANLLGANLQQISDGESSESDHELAIHDTFHMAVPNGAVLLPPGILNDLLNSEKCFKFALVRNPYTRIFSAWQSKILLQEPVQAAPYQECAFLHLPLDSPSDISSAFEAFLEYIHQHEAPDFRDHHWSTQHSLLRPDLIKYSNVAQIEDVGTLLASLESHMTKDRFANPFKMRRANESLIQYSQDFFSKRSIQLIRSMFQVDFEVFRYPIDLPFGTKSPSKGALETAIQGIHLLRGRHKRIASLRSSTARLKGDAEKCRNTLAEEQTANKGMTTELARRALSDEWLGDQIARLNVELSTERNSKNWHLSQRDSWAHLVQKLLAQVSSLNAALVLQKEANTWHVSQRDAWARLVHKLELKFSGLRHALEEERKANSWHRSERDAWAGMFETLNKRFSVVQDFLHLQREAITWHSSQSKAWMLHFSNLERRLNQVTDEVQRLQVANSWHLAQRNAWHECALKLEQRTKDLQSAVYQHLGACKWHASQTREWIGQAEQAWHRLEELQRVIAVNNKEVENLKVELDLVRSSEMAMREANVQLDARINSVEEKLTRIRSNLLMRWINLLSKNKYF